MIRTIVMLALGTLCAACAPVRIQGTVVEGDVTFIALVNADDPRLKGKGIADAKVAAVPQGAPGAAVRGVSDEKGRFSLPLKGTSDLIRPWSFEAAAPGYVTAREVSPTPTAGQRLLIHLQPLAHSVP
jgi:hypothetical protein